MNFSYSLLFCIMVSCSSSRHVTSRHVSCVQVALGRFGCSEVLSWRNTAGELP